jgi:hypothetical protein
VGRGVPGCRAQCREQIGNIASRCFHWINWGRRRKPLFSLDKARGRGMGGRGAALGGRVALFRGGGAWVAGRGRAWPRVAALGGRVALFRGMGPPLPAVAPWGRPRGPCGALQGRGAWVAGRGPVWAALGGRVALFRGMGGRAARRGPVWPP